MPEPEPLPDETIRGNHEVRDLPWGVVVICGIALAFGGFLLHAVLWEVESGLVPEARQAGASPPVVMPGEAPVNERLNTAGSPRLDGLEALQAEPPSYRSSDPVPGGHPRWVRPEDLRADRQPALQGYGWVDRDKGIAHIPIDRAMDIVAAGSRGKGKK